jgi:hypothetical protein
LIIEFPCTGNRLFRGFADLNSPSTRVERFSGSFAALLGLGTVAIGSLFNTVVIMVLRGANQTTLDSLLLSLAGVCLSAFGIIYLLYRLGAALGIFQEAR